MLDFKLALSLMQVKVQRIRKIIHDIEKEVMLLIEKIILFDKKISLFEKGGDLKKISQKVKGIFL